MGADRWGLGRSTDIQVGSIDPTLADLLVGLRSLDRYGCLGPSSVDSVMIGFDFVDISWPAWSIFYINPPALMKSPKLVETVSLNL